MKTRALCFALFAAFLFPLAALALEPTNLEPAEVVAPGEVELEQNVTYIDMDEKEWETQTELTVGLNKFIDIGVTVPFVFEENDSGKLDDIALFIESVFNPDSTSTKIGGEIDIILPTEEDSTGVSAEAQFRIAQPLGASGKHALHLNLVGFYDEVEKGHDTWWCDDTYDDHKFRFGATVGYTCNITDATTFIADVFYEEDYEGADEDATVAEIGFTHDFSDAFSFGLGVGAGLNSDSPDLIASALFTLRFNTGK